MKYDGYQIVSEAINEMTMSDIITAGKSAKDSIAATGKKVSGKLFPKGTTRGFAAQGLHRVANNMSPIEKAIVLFPVMPPGATELTVAQHLLRKPGSRKVAKAVLRRLFKRVGLGTSKLNPVRKVASGQPLRPPLPTAVPPTP